MQDTVWQRSAKVTFDDGYLSVFDTAAPLAQEIGIPITVFVTKSVIGRNGFWRDRIRWLIVNGYQEQFLEFARRKDPRFTAVKESNVYADTKNASVISSRLVDETLSEFLDYIGRSEEVASQSAGLHATWKTLSEATPNITSGNHTANHYVMSSLSAADQRQEIDACQEGLKRVGANVSKVFSVPSGKTGDLDADTLVSVAEAGFNGLHMSMGRINRTAQLPRGGNDRASGMTRLDRMMPANEQPRFLRQLLR